MDGKKIYNPVNARTFFLVAGILLLLGAPLADAQTIPADGTNLYLPDVRQLVPNVNDAPGVSAAVQILVIITVLSLAPAILVMVTCFTRIVVVLALLRQALATQQLPPNQVMIGLALFMTFMVMAPTWSSIQTNALTPYLNNTINQEQAFDLALKPIREFMIRQIEATDNEQDVYMFLAHTNPENTENLKWANIPTTVLIPAFITSELKTAFIIGFRIYLPFLIIDMVISSVLISMGMLMLPPMLISMPFKLLLFVLVDGWHLVAGSLINSFV
ncbi:MAG: flagellar type III secretion system pore protein FliP [Phycisphaerae bacterium]|jgi:flagellar biosynthetic protein FliP|nr:flagellar type III secretion system pore protein FliP [Phycisphaerae bacterium]